MARVFAWFAMAGGFLVISPKLRDTIMAGFAQANSGLEQYSPYSYIGVAVGVLALAVMWFSKSSPNR
jgi:hypothetical protein